MKYVTEDNNKQQLGYQPSLTYIDDYTSELDNNITNNSINNNEDDDYNNGLEEIENLLDNMNNLNNIINGLPNNTCCFILFFQYFLSAKHEKSCQFCIGTWLATIKYLSQFFLHIT